MADLRPTPPPRRRRGRRIVVVAAVGVAGAVVGGVVRALRVDPVDPGADTWPPVPVKGDAAG